MNKPLSHSVDSFLPCTPKCHANLKLPIVAVPEAGLEKLHLSVLNV